MNIGRYSLALFSLIAAWQTGAADIALTVQGVRSDQGQVKLMLFEREEGFRKEEKARQILVLPAIKGDNKATFQSLPPGRYAVVAYHDENADGKLNLRFGMFPKEGYGLSNNFKPAGPPKFKDAAFELPNGGMQSAIQLAY